MSIFRLAAEIFLIYILYKFVFDFVIPIYESTKKIRRQVSDMHSQMQEDMTDIQAVREKSRKEAKATRDGDYIEFEEIKK
jgi:hypothetical protein